MLGAAAGSLEKDFWTMRQARIALAENQGVDEAMRQELRQALERLRRANGPRAHFPARAMLVLALVEARLGNATAALALADESARAQPSGLHYYHPQHLAEIDELLAQLTNDADQRIAHLRRAEERLREVFPDTHVAVSRASLLRAMAESDAGHAVDTPAAIAAFEVLAAQQVADAPLLRQIRHWLSPLLTRPAELPEGLPTPPIEPDCR